MKLTKFLFGFVFLSLIMLGSVVAVTYPYWIEHDENGNAHRYVWIKLNLTAGETKQIMITKEPGFNSNGNSVFDFFDDFNETSLDASKWMEWSSYNTGSYSVANSILTINGGSGAWEFIGTTSRVFTHPKIVEEFVKSNEQDQYGFILIDDRIDNVYLGSGNDRADWERTSTEHSNIFFNEGFYHTVSRTFDLSAYTNLKTVWSNEYSWNKFCALYENDSLAYNETNIVPQDDSGITFATHDVNSLYIDWVFTRKYSSQEPSIFVSQEANHYIVTIINNEATTLNDYQVAIPINELNITEANESLNISDLVNVEQTEQVADVEQPTNVTIQSTTSWQNILNFDFNLTNSSNVSMTYVVNAISKRNVNTELSCKIKIDGVNYGSRVDRTMNYNQAGVLYLSTTAFELSNGTHRAKLKCKLNNYASKVTIFNSHGIVKIYQDKVTQNHLNLKNVNTTGTITSTDYTLIGSVNFTTTDNNVSAGYSKYIVLDGGLQYDYISTGTITTKVVIRDGQNTSFEFPRYGEAGDSGSIGGLRISAPINLSDSTNITIDFYAKSTTGDGSVNGNLVIDEILLKNTEVNQTTLNNTNITNSTSYVNLANLTLTSDESANVIVKATIPIKSIESGSRIRFRLRMNGTNGAEIIRDVSNANQYGVAVIQDVFQINGGTHHIYLDVLADTNCSISGGVFGTYLADVEPIQYELFNVTAYNIWDNSSIQNFTVTLMNTSAQFEAINGTAIIIPNDFFENLTISSDGYFNESVYNHNISENLNQSMKQNIITIVLKHLISNENIPGNISLNIDDGYWSDNITYEHTFYFNSSNHNFVFQKSQYVTSTESLNLTNQHLNTTIIYYLSPIINFNFRDEKTTEQFNLSKPNLITVQVYCSNTSKGVIQENINDNNTDLNLTCQYDKIKFIVEFPSDTYYRTYPNVEGIFTIDDFNLTIWLLDLNTTQVILNLFQVYDLFNEYKNPKILFYKTIGNTNYLITGDIVDIENKISAYLMQNSEYTVKVLSDNMPEKNIGTYFADVAGESIIRLFTIDLNSTTTSFSSLVRQYIYLVNDSGNIKVKAAVYTDDDSIIKNSEFIVRYNTEAGEIICQQSSLEPNVEYSCDVPDNINNIYWAQLDIIDSADKHHYYERTLQGTDKVNFDFDFSTNEKKLWFWNFTIIILFLLIAFLPFPVGVKTLVFLIIMMFINVMDWASLSNLPSLTISQNKAIANTILSVLMLLSIIKVLKK